MARSRASSDGLVVAAVIILMIVLVMSNLVIQMYDYIDAPPHVKLAILAGTIASLGLLFILGPAIIGLRAGGGRR